MNTDIPIKEIKKILVVRRGAIGDVVLGLPAVHAIKTAYPEIEISWLVHTKAYSAIKNHPDIDHVIELDNYRVKFFSTFLVGVFSYFWTLWSLGFKKYDLVISYNNSKLSERLLMRWTGAKYRVLVSPSVSCQPFLTHVFAPGGPHLVDGTLQMAKILGINVTE
ncbi:MAG: glycosyltransferase family 9 protein, partial [Thermoguttaceae bacterium]